MSLTILVRYCHNFYSFFRNLAAFTKRLKEAIDSAIGGTVAHFNAVFTGRHDPKDGSLA